MNQMYKKITFMQQRFLLLAFALVVGLLMSGFKQMTQFNLPAQQVKVQQEQTENGRELESPTLSHSILSEIVNETKEDPSISQQESVQNDSIIIQNVGVIAKLIDTVVMRSLTKSQNMNLDSLQKKTYLEVYASMFDHYKNYDSMLFKIAQNQYEMAKELHSKKGDHLELLKDTLVFKGFAEDFQKIIKMNNDFEETMKFFDRESPEFQNWFNLIASRHQQHNQRIKLLQDALLDSVQHNKVYPEDFLKNLKKQTLGLSSQGEEQLLLMKQLLSKNMMQLQKQRAITDQEKLMHDKINAQMKKLLQLEQ